MPANGLRYPLVGGRRERGFDGTNFELRKLPENAQTPTSRVHAVLGCLFANRVLSEGIRHTIPLLSISILCYFSPTNHLSIIYDNIINHKVYPSIIPKATNFDFSSGFRT